MTIGLNKIQSSFYLDNNGNPLLTSGTNITITPGAQGDYTVGSIASIIAFTTTTNSTDGTVVIDLTSYSFVNPPIVKLTTVNSSTTQANWGDIVTVTTTSLTIRTFITQSVVASLTTTLNPVVAALNVVVNVILTRV